MHFVVDVKRLQTVRFGFRCLDDASRTRCEWVDVEMLPEVDTLLVHQLKQALFCRPVQQLMGCFLGRIDIFLVGDEFTGF